MLLKQLSQEFSLNVRAFYVTSCLHVLFLVPISFPVYQCLRYHRLTVYVLLDQFRFPFCPVLSTTTFHCIRCSISYESFRFRLIEYVSHGYRWLFSLNSSSINYESSDCYFLVYLSPDVIDFSVNLSSISYRKSSDSSVIILVPWIVRKFCFWFRFSQCTNAVRFWSSLILL